MQTITAHDRQTLFDIALQVYGRPDFAFELALQNDLCLSDTVAPLSVLGLPLANRTTNAAVADAYELNGIVPTSAIDTAEFKTLNPEGIGYWFIKLPLPIFTIA